MAIHQITAIRKPDRYSSHEHITHVRYDFSIHTVEDVIRAITNRTDTFFVQSGNAKAWVEVVRSLSKRTHIRTVPDWTGKDNLLSLPEC